MRANQRKVHRGGLMRCCLATIAECNTETTTLRCDHCGEPMAVGEDGAWKWDRPDPRLVSV